MSQKDAYLPIRNNNKHFIVDDLALLEQFRGFTVYNINKQ